MTWPCSVTAGCGNYSPTFTHRQRSGRSCVRSHVRPCASAGRDRVPVSDQSRRPEPTDHPRTRPLCFLGRGRHFSIEVHGHQKQGASFGYSGVRGLNTILATAKTVTGAPIILGQRLRRGACSSPHGSTRLIRDALATLRRLPGMSAARILFRADSAFYTFAAINAALAGGADVSVTARLDSAVRKRIAAIPAAGWTPIKYTHAIFDEDTRTWISDAEVAEIPYTAFTSRKKTDHISGRLIVRRIPELNKHKLAGQTTLFDLHRFHAFFTTSTLDTVAADKTHRAHAAIELVNSDLKSSALAHMPSVILSRLTGVHGFVP